MRTIRENTQRYIDEHNSPAEIDVEKLFREVYSISALTDPKTAQERCARQDFCQTFNANGYFRSIEGTIINEKCTDPQKLAFVANKANKSRKVFSFHHNQFKQLAYQCDGQMKFEVDAMGNLMVI